MGVPTTEAVRALSGEREPCRVATTANITLSGLQTIDGVTLEAGDRVLAKSQTDATQNGIYTASEGLWYRAPDARSTRMLQKGSTVHIQQGTLNAGRVFAFQTNDPVIGEDTIVLGEIQSVTDRLGIYETRAIAATKSISSDVNTILVSGLAAAGDSPPASYKRVVSGTVSPILFQSADGAKWQIAGEEVTITQVVAGLGMVADVGPAIQALVTAGYGVRIPRGHFVATSQVVIPRGYVSHLEIEPGGYLHTNLGTALIVHDNNLTALVPGLTETRLYVSGGRITQIGTAKTGIAVKCWGIPGDVTTNWLHVRDTIIVGFANAFDMQVGSGNFDNVGVNSCAYAFFFRELCNFIWIVNCLFQANDNDIYGDAGAWAAGYTNTLYVVNTVCVQTQINNIYLVGWDALFFLNNGFDAGGSGTGNNQAAISLNSCSSIYIMNNFVISLLSTSGRFGILLNACHIANVQANFFLQNNRGVYAIGTPSYSASILISDNSFLDADAYHVVADGIRALIIDNNRMDGSPRTAGGLEIAFVNIPATPDYKIGTNLLGGASYTIATPAANLIVETQIWNAVVE